jgi:hypothetical protein
MIDNANERQVIFAEAILKTAEQYPEAAPFTPPLSWDPEDLALVVGSMLAAGNAGTPVWLAGGEFCHNLLANVADADSYEVCGLLRAAIESPSAGLFGEGAEGGKFLTPEFREQMQSRGVLTPSN